MLFDPGILLRQPLEVLAVVLIVSLKTKMHVISPDGGPTTISVEVPCGS